MNIRIPAESAAYIKDWLSFRYEQGDIPGMVVAIYQDGKIVFNEAYGYADLEKKVKMTPEHIFRIASHSKTFTAVAIMQLQEKGKLRVDDYVVGYIPWLKQHKDKRWQKVTIRQLLSHGAGVIRDGLDNNYWQLYRSFPNDEQFKKDILEADLVLDNNIKMKYSNYGYSLLGYVVQAASGQPYNQYVTEHIVEALGLKDTGPELSRKIETRLVTGYSAPNFGKKRKPIAHIDTKAMSPATGFYSTAKDLCAYFAAHMISSGKLLDDESKKEMQRTHWGAENVREKTEYGLGLEIEYADDIKLFGHGGGFPGHITNSYFWPEEKVIVVVLTNGMRSGVGGISKGIIKTIKYVKSKDAPPKELARFRGSFMSLWSTIDFIPIGKKLLAISPDTWEPFEYPDELKKIDTNTFKIIKADSFGNEGEFVHFNVNKSGKIESVKYAGQTLLPREDYLRENSPKKRISIPQDRE